ncbi:MAG: hypothetical protein MUF08_18245 [Burkholderiaceae bacterium]|nr:hypothetical protein [Burkholderiaceae bacterium]
MSAETLARSLHAGAAMHSLRGCRAARRAQQARRPPPGRGAASRGAAVLALWLALWLAPAAAAGAADDAAKAAALQACPTVEEEIVDLNLLAEGLKASSAVGLLEKIRLKSAIDDLVGRFKAFHAGATHYTQAELQQQYDLLLMRIAAHLQHKDQLLHGQLCNAWETIWLDLVDGERFAKRAW